MRCRLLPPCRRRRHIDSTRSTPAFVARLSRFHHRVNGAAMARRSLQAITPGWIRPFESAEHQAKIFVPAFLINDAEAQSLNAEELSITFGLSLPSARIYVVQRDSAGDHDAAAERIQRRADEYRASVSIPKSSQPVNFINDYCSICGKATLFPVDHKFMCQTCDTIYDRYQDGDKVD